MNNIVHRILNGNGNECTLERNSGDNKILLIYVSISDSNGFEVNKEKKKSEI